MLFAKVTGSIKHKLWEKEIQVKRKIKTLK